MSRLHALSSSLSLVACAASVLAVGGCQQFKLFVDGEQQKPFPVLIRVERDPGKPLQGVPILYQGNPVKSTAADGTALLELHKPDGANVELTITCPPDTRPAEPLKVFVRRVEGQKYTEQRMYCRPSMRNVAVSIRADEGANLPVMYLGLRIAVTDESGAAHYSWAMAPGQRIKVGLDATGNKKLFPPTAAVEFTVGDQDEVFQFYQKFTAEKKVVRSGPRRSAPKPL